MATASEHGIEAVSRFLDECGVDCEVVEHRQTFTAVAEARAAGIEPDHAAKTIALRDADGYQLAVLPASHRLDMVKLRDALGAGGQLRLATEDEMKRDLGTFDLGALPPLGPMLPAPEVLDSRLMDHERILCSGGDHKHSLLLDPQEVVRVAEPTIADICED